MACPARLWFDAAAGDDVRPITERIAYFATPRGKSLPPPVRFVWGEFRFDGHVEALDETLDLFSSDGRALRARLALTLRNG